MADVHEDDEPHEDGADLDKHLAEEDGKLADIKGFALIRTTTKDLRAITHEVTDCLYSCPGKYIRGEAWLVG